MKLHLLILVSAFAALQTAKVEKCYHCNDTKCDESDTVDCEDKVCITVLFKDGWIEKGCVEDEFEGFSYCGERATWHGNRTSCITCDQKDLCNDK